MKYTFFISLFFVFAFAKPALSQVEASQSITGIWKTIDDNNNEAKSHVEIFEKDGKLYGKVVKILDPAKEDGLCFNCEGPRYNQPVLGMVIMNDMEKEDDVYEDGEILDPENGKTYRCKIWLDEENKDRLNVRGYVAFFYRTQQWVRVK